IRLLTPNVPREGKPNTPQVAFLNSQGVDVRVTTERNPGPGALPYMHAKTMVVDGRRAYVGSIDLMTTEASQDRESGLLFRVPTLIRQLRSQFASDWTRAAVPQDGRPS